MVKFCDFCDALPSLFVCATEASSNLVSMDKNTFLTSFQSLRCRSTLINLIKISFLLVVYPCLFFLAVNTCMSPTKWKHYQLVTVTREYPSACATRQSPTETWHTLFIISKIEIDRYKPVLRSHVLTNRFYERSQGSSLYWGF